MILRALIPFCCALWLVSSLPAQSSLDSWGDLKLDKWRREDVVALFGKPAKDKENQKLRTVIQDFDWLDKEARYRRLEFKKIQGAKKARLYFKGGFLRAIEIHLAEKSDPNSLQSEYGIEFSLKTSAMTNDLYYLIGIAEAAFVVAEVDVRGFHRTTHYSNLREQIQKAPSLPGKVSSVQLISGTLRKGYRRLLVQAAAQGYPEEGGDLDFFTCQGLDERGIALPDEWLEKYGITKWQEGYRHPKVKPLIEKLFSSDRKTDSG